MAFGSPQYGRLAYNLAVSLKAVEADCEITVVYHGKALSHLSQAQQCIFNQITELPAGIEPNFGVKLHLDKLTPYDETLYLDVDMAWVSNKTPSHLFNTLKDATFTGITEGFYDLETDVDNGNEKYYYWAEPKDIKATYKLTDGTLYQWRSEVLYFKKCPAVTKLFKQARAVHANSKLKTALKFRKTQVPDELGINVSAAINNVDPHEYNWMPAYWPKLNKNHIPSPAELSSSYYLLSVGGEGATGSIKQLYNRIMSVAFRKAGLQYVFTLPDRKVALR